MAKIVSMNLEVDELIRLAKKSNQQAQLALYDRYSAKMLGVCRHYIRDQHFAEDVMIGAFHKALESIQAYEPYGSFEGWLRRIMVRESISYLRVQKNKFDVVEVNEGHFYQKPNQDPSDDSEEIQMAIDALPVGCKTIFNLYVIEGYKHYEIAELLEVSVGTSKSQLAHARKLLQSQLSHLNSKNDASR